MERRARAEAALHLAMLPAGVVLTLGAAVAVIGFAILALVDTVSRSTHRGWLILWALAGVSAAIRNLLWSIDVMNALDWRKALLALALWGVIVAAYPGWWLPAA